MNLQKTQCIIHMKRTARLVAQPTWWKKRQERKIFSYAQPNKIPKGPKSKVEDISPTENVFAQVKKTDKK